jgi:hypothetical protein
MMDELNAELAHAQQMKGAAARAISHANAAKQRALQHREETQQRLLYLRARQEIADEEYRRQFEAWSRNESEKPALPEPIDTSIVERELALAATAIEDAEREVEAAASAYGEASRVADWRLVVVVRAEADAIARRLFAAKEEIEAGFDALTVIADLRAPGDFYAIGLSEVAKTVLRDVAPLVDGRFPPDVARSREPLRERWKQRIAELAGPTIDPASTTDDAASTSDAA